MSINPPYRADVVGSFLRPEALKRARAARAAGEIDADALREVVLSHPDAIDAISRLVVQRRVGLDAAHAAGRDEATMTAQSASLIDRMRRFLRL